MARTLLPPPPGGGGGYPILPRHFQDVKTFFEKNRKKNLRKIVDTPEKTSYLLTMKTFIEDKTELLNEISACKGDTAKLAHALSQALDKLQSVISQAEAQFKVGDRHATFNKDFIENLKKIS